MVKIAVGNNALNGLYFYPKPVQERAFEIGLTDQETGFEKTRDPDHDLGRRCGHSRRYCRACVLKY